MYVYKPLTIFPSMCLGIAKLHKYRCIPAYVSYMSICISLSTILHQYV